MDKRAALIYLQKELTYLNPFTREAIETLHPELKDSENEGIRKGLLHHLEDLKDWRPGKSVPIKTPEHYDAWIKYLEDMKEEPDPFNNIISRFSIHKYDDDSDTIFLSDVYVGEDIRGKGNGTKILKVVDTIAKKMGAKCICLKVLSNSMVEDWYKNNGYCYHMSDGEYNWLKKYV